MMKSKFLLSKINIAKIISFFALFIGLIGFSISLWNISICKESFNNALKTQKENEAKNFEELKLESLEEIADDQKIMDIYLIEIVKLKTKLDSEPKSIKDSMKNSIDKLNKYTKIVTLSLEDFNLERQKITDFSNVNDYHNLVIEKANFYRDFKTNIILKQYIQNSIDEFSINLQLEEKKHKSHSSLSGGELIVKIFSPEIMGEIPKSDTSFKPKVDS